MYSSVTDLKKTKVILTWLSRISCQNWKKLQSHQKNSLKIYSLFPILWKHTLDKFLELTVLSQILFKTMPSPSFSTKTVAQVKKKISEKIDFGVPCHRELLEWGVGVLYFNKCQELINWSVNYLTSLQSALVKSTYRLSQTPPLPPPPHLIWCFIWMGCQPIAGYPQYFVRFHCWFACR